MIAKFRIEAVTTFKKEVQIFCSYSSEDTYFRLSDSLFLGEFAIKNKMHLVRASDKDGIPKPVLLFILRNAIDKERIKANDIFEMWNDYVDVMESYLSPIGVIAFLRCYVGKYEEEYILEDNTKKQWILKRYVTVMGSLETYEKIEKEEKEGIFQYLLQPIEHKDKPVAGAKLKIHRR